MTKNIKIILIIAGFLLCSIIFNLLKQALGGSPGIIGVILIVAYVAFARAIWNYGKDKSENNNKLDKTLK